eukprot:scaffold245508_cov18-Prasinocladus_malaysianus.AAC.1
MLRAARDVLVLVRWGDPCSECHTLSRDGVRRGEPFAGLHTTSLELLAGYTSQTQVPQPLTIL